MKRAFIICACGIFAAALCAMDQNVTSESRNFSHAAHSASPMMAKATGMGIGIGLSINKVKEGVTAETLGDACASHADATIGRYDALSTQRDVIIKACIDAYKNREATMAAQTAR